MNNSLKFGKFLRRYKRFFADVEYNTEVIVCHNPNTGSMKNLLIEGVDVVFSESNNKDRKLKYTLEGFKIDGVWIYTNTINVNNIVYNALLDGTIEQFHNCDNIKREYKIGDKRIDFYIEYSGKKALVEVKSVSLFDDNFSMFPDAVSKRAQEHLETLYLSIYQGYEPYILYIIQSDRKKFRCAVGIDPTYCEIYKRYVPKYITPLFYRNIFDPYSGNCRLERLSNVTV